MIPNNNLSVLPWYSSIEEQNARKWWAYDRVYPLFTPAGFLLPFQIINNSISQQGSTLEPVTWQNGYYDNTGGFHSLAPVITNTYNVTGMSSVYLVDIPSAINRDGAVMAIAINGNADVLQVLNPSGVERYTGIWNLPSGTTQIRVLVYEPIISRDYGSVKTITQDVEIREFSLFTRDGQLVGDYTDLITPFLTITPYPTFGYSVIVFGGQVPIFPSMNDGQYYARIKAGDNTWYSEVFTVVNGNQPYLKLEWWDNEDFVMDAGRIVYKYANNTQYKNILYLCADIAKPTYKFTEEGEERNGYFFPTKQISKKVFHINFLASEYLLDILRFVRMSDYVEIEQGGKRYSIDTFEINSDWEGDGDVASVDVDFTTATVAKKVGVGYIKALRGDFNDDFNNDYNV